MWRQIMPGPWVDRWPLRTEKKKTTIIRDRSTTEVVDNFLKFVWGGGFKLTCPRGPPLSPPRSLDHRTFPEAVVSTRCCSSCTLYSSLHNPRRITPGLKVLQQSPVWRPPVWKLHSAEQFYVQPRQSSAAKHCRVEDSRFILLLHSWGGEGGGASEKVGWHSSIARLHSRQCEMKK